jgi:hypothetical protein
MKCDYCENATASNLGVKVNTKHGVEEIDLCDVCITEFM